MQVAHDLLIGAAKKQANPVGLAVFELMEFEQRLGAAAGDKAGQLAVGVAGEVGEAAELARLPEQLRRLAAEVVDSAEWPLARAGSAAHGPPGPYLMG